jgi:peptidyl-tRNA hydrolase
LRMLRSSSKKSLMVMGIGNDDEEEEESRHSWGCTWSDQVMNLTSSVTMSWSAS